MEERVRLAGVVDQSPAGEEALDRAEGKVRCVGRHGVGVASDPDADFARVGGDAERGEGLVNGVGEKGTAMRRDRPFKNETATVKQACRQANRLPRERESRRIKLDLMTGSSSDAERSLGSRWSLNYERLPAVHGLHVFERDVDAHQFFQQTTALVKHAGRQAHLSKLVVLALEALEQVPLLVAHLARSSAHQHVGQEA